MDHNAHAVSVFNKMAGRYEAKFMDVSRYSASLDFFCAHIPEEQASILELACGPGNITQYLLRRRPDFRILATDLAPDMLRIAEAHNRGVTFQLLDCRAVHTLGSTFDGLVCGFALPYLSGQEAAGLIQDAAARLRPGGLFYLSTMEGDDQSSGYKTGSNGDAIYMHYYRQAWLSRALGDAGFRIVYSERKPYADEEGNADTDLILIGAKDGGF